METTVPPFRYLGPWYMYANGYSVGAVVLAVLNQDSAWQISLLGRLRMFMVLL